MYTILTHIKADIWFAYLNSAVVTEGPAIHLVLATHLNNDFCDVEVRMQTLVY